MSKKELILTSRSLILMFLPNVDAAKALASNAKIKIKPHSEICPKGAVIEAEKGSSLCEAMLDNKINIEHACELSCACTTCHVIVTSGFGEIK